MIDLAVALRACPRRRSRRRPACSWWRRAIGGERAGGRPGRGQREPGAGAAGRRDRADAVVRHARSPRPSCSAWRGPKAPSRSCWTSLASSGTAACLDGGAAGRANPLAEPAFAASDRMTSRARAAARARERPSGGRRRGPPRLPRGGEDCALPLLSVQRIVGPRRPVARARRRPPALRGVMHLREAMRSSSWTWRSPWAGAGGRGRFESCALVVADTVEDGPAAVGLAVDGVSGVIGLAPEQIAPAPRLGTLLDAHLVAAMAQVGRSLRPGPGPAAPARLAGRARRASRPGR